MGMGMGMMGMQGGQQRAAPMKDQPAAELREDQVQEAIAFVGKPEVRTQKLRKGQGVSLAAHGPHKRRARGGDGPVRLGDGGAVSFQLTAR
jgi:hypothetical protein